MINSKVSMRLDGRFIKQAKGVIEKHNFEVGVLENRAYKLPISANESRKAGWKKNAKLSPSQAKALGALKTVAGGPARKTSRTPSGLSVGEVSELARKQTGINFYTKPFRARKNQDLVRFVKAFFQVVKGKRNVKQLENSLQAIVRNPITRGDYGGNKASTALSKGFSRLLIDTGQLFKAIRARVTKRV